MKNRFSFAEEASSFLYRVLIPIYLAFWLPAGFLIANAFVSGEYDIFLFWILVMLFAGIVPYLLYTYKIPYYVGFADGVLQFKNKKGKCFKKIVPCSLNFGILSLPLNGNLEESLEKNKKALIILEIIGKNWREMTIGASPFNSGSVSMKKAVEFQHWLIEHIKENCPEEVYKEAMKHWIDYDLGEEHKEEALT